jgi:hypothetical protein
MNTAFCLLVLSVIPFFHELIRQPGNTNKGITLYIFKLLLHEYYFATKLYDLLTIKVGKEIAENLTSFIEEKIKNEMMDKTNILATKESLAENKAEIIKWMFIFWVGQVAVTFGFILVFLKK